jgi:UDP-2,4-diacetamido-2,4,6-trideoxy-beta-L-altropyranose hydrolase
VSELETKAGPVIVVRADASATIGGGHVMRCLALGDTLRDAGATCWFAGLADTAASVPVVGQSGHHWLAIDAPGNAASLRRALARAGIGACDWLIVDHYGWSGAEEAACRAWAGNIMVIDDLADRHHDCDVLLDQTFGRAPADYKGLVPSSATKLLGTAYALLRAEFAVARPDALRRRSAGALKRVLIAMGLTDAPGATSRVLSALLASGLPIEIDVALGAAAPHIAEVERLAAQTSGRVKLHRASRAMAVLMTNADFAFGAAGSTSWERCCLGLPAALMTLADNQKEIAARLSAASAAIDLGTLQDIDSHLLVRTVQDLMHDPARLTAISLAAATICDGRGCARVAMWLAPERAEDGEKVWLRPATTADCALLYTWQCEPGTRRYARNARVPAPEEHRAWLAARLDDPDCLLNVIMRDNTPAGSLRLDLVEPRAFEISIVISAALQGRGLGRAALTLARRLVPEAELRAEIVAGNARSEALFTGAGFVPPGYGMRRLPPLTTAMLHKPGRK